MRDVHSVNGDEAHTPARASIAGTLAVIGGGLGGAATGIVVGIVLMYGALAVYGLVVEALLDFDSSHSAIVAVSAIALALYVTAAAIALFLARAVTLRLNGAQLASWIIMIVALAGGAYFGAVVVGGINDCATDWGFPNQDEPYCD